MTNLNILHPFATDITANSTQHLYIQNPRGASLGYKVLTDIPDFLATPPSLTPQQATAYLLGVTTVLNKHAQLYIKNNSPAYNTDLPPLTPELLTQLTTPATRSITKASVLELFESQLLPLVVNKAIDMGLDDAQAQNAVVAYRDFFSRLASPSINYAPDITAKLLELLRAVEFDTPTSLALITRLEKMNTTTLTDLI